MPTKSGPPFALRARTRTGPRSGIQSSGPPRTSPRRRPSAVRARVGVSKRCHGEENHPSASRWVAWAQTPRPPVTSSAIATSAISEPMTTAATRPALFAGADGGGGLGSVAADMSGHRRGGVAEQLRERCLDTARDDDDRALGGADQLAADATD